VPTRGRPHVGSRGAGCRGGGTVKPARTPQAAPESPVRVEFKVRFAGGPKGRRRALEETTAASARQATPAESPGTAAPNPANEVSFGQLPKITRLLVLGHHFEKLV